jgi:hypothetical protein
MISSALVVDSRYLYLEKEVKNERQVILKNYIVVIAKKKLIL